ncbi:formate dehydrogenase [Methylovorus sp. MM2]|uniref:formate dehydrogenase subunit delta n=1 Tax=Methylovorus sp. MM2 TaxID=1848038 RepID=UPI0007E0C7EF|nr:formate dehydrogenase subunit delta [Methylovorus sp. MM2]OAM52747.1 formate dehydrogenase [Methylovorus sp. MM2]
MNIEQLIKMANQIGEFFFAYPDAEQAKLDIVSHIKRFWALSMRKQIVEYVTEEQGTALQPLVVDAIKENVAVLA